MTEEPGGAMRALILLLLVASSTAWAAEWVAFTNSENAKSQIFVDMSSVASTDETLYSGRDMRKAWIKIEFKTDQASEKHGKPLNFRSTLSLFYFDCSERKVAIGQAFVYDAKKNQVDNESVDPVLLDFQNVPPESSGEAMLDTVCKAPVRDKR